MKQAPIFGFWFLSGICFERDSFMLLVGILYAFSIEKMKNYLQQQSRFRAQGLGESED